MGLPITWAVSMPSVRLARFVPRDVSVVGANDNPMLSRMAPALTTINTPMYKMGS